jgi:hypothetical protein
MSRRETPGIATFQAMRDTNETAVTDIALGDVGRPSLLLRAHASGRLAAAGPARSRRIER